MKKKNTFNNHLRPQRQFVIEKQDTSTAPYTTTELDSYEYFSDTESTTEQTGGGDIEGQGQVKTGFVSIANSSYKKPTSGTIQDNLTSDEIKKKLKGYIPLKSMQEKKTLTKLPLYKTWVRYINTETKMFRTGGLLMKVAYPTYIMLVNPDKRVTWSVQLDENVIYIKDPSIVEQQKEQETKEKEIKDKLFDMYTKGLLQKRNV